MSKVERRTMLLRVSDDEDSLILQNPQIKEGASIEIARGQVEHSKKSDIECRLTEGNVSLVFTPEYLKGVRQLDPVRQGEHIIRMAKSFREANEISFTRRKTSKK